MAVAGGFRLAFWSEEAEHHGPRLERALARYARYADARPAGFPAGAVAAFARFLAEHTPRQDGPEHGMAYDVQRFNELTKQMSAYAHYTRDGPPAAGRRPRAPARASAPARRAAQQPAAAAVPHRRRRAGRAAAARLRAARLRLPGPSGGRAASSTRHAKRTERLAERDERLRAGQHPGRRRRPLPRRLHLRGAVGPRDAAGTVDGDASRAPRSTRERLARASPRRARR